MVSCRVCGGELEPTLICPACEQLVQWRCISCAKETDASVHSHNKIIVEPLDLERYRTGSAPRTEKETRTAAFS